MYADINLATRQGKKSPKKELVQRFRIISMVILFVVVGLSVVSFLLDIRFSVNSIRKKEAEATKTLSVFNDTIAKIYLLNSRLTDISDILNNRRDLDKSVGQIFSAADASSVGVESYSIGQDQTFTVIVSSTSLLNLSDFLNKVIALASSNNIKGVKMEGLTIDQNGYSMTVDVGSI